MSIEGYYNECIQTAKNEILAKTKEYIIGVKTEELVEYYAASFALPPLVVDFDHGEYDETVSSRLPDIPVDLRFPVKLEPRIEKVVTCESNPHLLNFRLGLDGDRLVVFVRIPTDIPKPSQRIENAIKLAKQQIEYKNKNVEAGNARIRHELKNFIERLDRIPET